MKYDITQIMFAMKRYIKPLVLSVVAVSVLAVKGLLAGDFLQLDRVPAPTDFNDAGLPIYESYWNPVSGLPSECSEAIGEEGAQHYAERMGWKKLLTAPDKGTVKQGFDQVWKDEKRDVVIVVEAKGRKYKGAGGHYFRPSQARHQFQASVEWCIEVCKEVRHSKKSTRKSKEVAEIVLKAISEGRFESRIIVTSHVHGIPFDTWTARAVLKVPDEYIGLSSDQLCYLVLNKGEAPRDYGVDFRMIKYGTEWEREQLRWKAKDDNGN